MVIVSISAYMREEPVPQHVDDGSLIAAFLEGNGAALHAKYRPLVRGTLGRVGVRESDLDDVAQQVWLIVLQKVYQLRDVRSFPGWLRSTARNTGLNFLTRSHPLPSAESMLSSVAGRGSTPDVIQLTEERAASVRGAMRRLTPLDRVTLEQFYFDGRSLVEMSGTDPYPAPVGTIKRRLHVARKRLGRVLMEETDLLFP